MDTYPGCYPVIISLFNRDTKELSDQKIVLVNGATSVGEFLASNLDIKPPQIFEKYSLMRAMRIGIKSATFTHLDDESAIFQDVYREFMNKRNHLLFLVIMPTNSFHPHVSFSFSKSLDEEQYTQYEFEVKHAVRTDVGLFHFKKRYTQFQDLYDSVRNCLWIEY